MTKKEALLLAVDELDFEYLAAEHGERKAEIQRAIYIINNMIDEMTYFEQRRKANES
jgi:hypothetical protein